MSTRPEAAAILGISQRTLRRYLSEFSAFLSSDRDLSAFDLELIKVIHTGKRTGQKTSQEIRERLVQLIRQTDSLPDSLADLTASVQNMLQPQSQSAEPGGQNASITQQDLVKALMPLFALVEGLRNDMRQLSAQIEPASSQVAALAALPKAWRPMPLPPPPPRSSPKRVAWWRVLIWPELQRNGS